MMTNVVLVGYFTVGDSPDLHDDRDVIESVSKGKGGYAGTWGGGATGGKMFGNIVKNDGAAKP